VAQVADLQPRHPVSERNRMHIRTTKRPINDNRSAKI